VKDLGSLSLGSCFSTLSEGEGGTKPTVNYRDRCNWIAIDPSFFSNDRNADYIVTLIPAEDLKIGIIYLAADS